ncbi:MAG TPA: zinc ribbon domain-containing protein [Verrucomicrobiae bacterium]
MPTYEYVCEKCGHQFEKFQSITAKPLTVCPEELCARKRWGKGRVKRLLGAGGGLLFKGSGFYITDYRSESYKQAAKKETTPATGSGGESKADKPAAKATPEAKPAKPAPKTATP